MQRLDPDTIDMYSYLTSFISTSTPDRVATHTEKVVGRHLEDNILSTTVSPDGMRVFYLIDSGNGSVGLIDSVMKDERVKVWSSPLKSISVSWNADNTIVLYTKPTQYGDGFVWILNPNTEDTALLLGSERALAAKTNPTGDKLLYSLIELDTGVISLRMLDIDTGVVKYLPFSTIVEKCTWSTAQTDTVYCAIPNNITEKNYIEKWYYGTILSDDVLWQINTLSGNAELVLDPEDKAADTFDIQNISVSPNEDYLTFVTKNTGILWAARIPEDIRPKEASPNEGPAE